MKTLNIGTFEVYSQLKEIKANRSLANSFISSTMDIVNDNFKLMIISTEVEYMCEYYKYYKQMRIKNEYSLNKENAHLLEPTTQLLSQIEDVADLFNVEYYISGSTDYSSEPNYLNIIENLDDEEYDEQIQALYSQLEGMDRQSRQWNTSTC